MIRCVLSGRKEMAGRSKVGMALGCNGVPWGRRQVVGQVFQPSGESMLGRQRNLDLPFP